MSKSFKNIILLMTGSIVYFAVASGCLMYGIQRDEKKYAESPRLRFYCVRILHTTSDCPNISDKSECLKFVRSYNFYYPDYGYNELRHLICKCHPPVPQKKPCKLGYKVTFYSGERITKLVEACFEEE